MIQKITCAANTTDSLIFQQLADRMLLSGINVDNINHFSKYIYFDVHWDDTDMLKTSAIQKSNHGNAGAKPKKLIYEGNAATCGLVWNLRTQGHLSDADIGLVLGASESTICRRRKRHMANGEFFENSEIIF